MMGKTHSAGGALCMLIVFQIFQSKGLLIKDINPLLQLAVMYPFCSWGSRAPDLDQSDEAIPDKDPLSIGIHKALMKFDAKHRSWQTHSVILTGSICFLLFSLVGYMNIFGLTGLSYESVVLLRLMFAGLATGVTSHLLLDMLTRQGIHFVPYKWIRLVPNTEFFSTNSTWETVVRFAMYVAIIALSIRLILYSFVLK